MKTPFDETNARLAAEVAADQLPKRVFNALTDPRVLDQMLGEPQRAPGQNEPVTTNPALQRMIDGR